MNCIFGKKLYWIVMEGEDIKIRYISNNFMFVVFIEIFIVFFIFVEGL